MHQRKNIRDAVVAALAPVTANITVGIVYPEQPDNLPSVNVLTGDETVVEEEDVMASMGAITVIATRTLEMQMEVRALADPLDDALDAIALEVEQALGADETLGGQAKRIRYTGCTTDRAGDLEQPSGLMTMAYEVFYRVDSRDPQTSED